MTAGSGEFQEFWHQHYARLVRWLTVQGATPADAEEAAQVAFIQVWHRWPEVAHRRGYLYRVARNELIGFWLARRGPGVLRAGPAAADQQVAGDVPLWLQAETVRQVLRALPGRQRAVLAGRYDGYQDAELAAVLGMPAATIRSHRRHARTTLRSFAAALEQDPRGLELRRAYAEMRGGNPSPDGARPVISRSWARSAQYLTDPERGPQVPPLAPDELAWRRGTSPLGPACPAVCARQASATGLMVVVADTDGWVLWRAGARVDLCRADRDEHGDGACLAERSVGTSGVSLTLAARHPVLVRGAEHYSPAQHDLVCAGAPVRDRDGRLLGALCLSAPWRAAHLDMLKIVDEMARNVQRQIASPGRN